MIFIASNIQVYHTRNKSAFMFYVAMMQNYFWAIKKSPLTLRRDRKPCGHHGIFSTNHNHVAPSLNALMMSPEFQIQSFSIRKQVFIEWLFFSNYFNFLFWIDESITWISCFLLSLISSKVIIHVNFHLISFSISKSASIKHELVFPHFSWKTALLLKLF